MLGAFAMFTSCDTTEESVDVATTDVELSLSSSSDAEFSNGDAISVFAYQDFDVYAENAKYLYLSGAFKSSSPIAGVDGLRYVALYPYMDDAASSFTFEVADDQSDADDLESSALMVAFGSNDTVIDFAPAMSTIVFTVSDTLEDGELTVSAKGAVDCDLAYETLETSGSAMDIVANCDGDTYTVVVAPQSFSAGASFLSFEVDGKTYECEVASTFTLEAGDVCYLAVSVDGGDATYEEGTSPEDEQDGTTQSGDIAAELVSVDVNDIVIKTTMGDYSGTYYVGYTTASSFSYDYGSDASLLAEVLMYYEINEYQTDLSVVDNAYVFNTDYTVHLGTAWQLYPSTDYVVAVFGMNSLGEVLTDVTIVEASTEAVESAGSVAISIEEILYDDIVIKATPSSTTSNYMAFPLNLSDYETYFTSAEECAYYFISYLTYYGFDPATADGYYFFNGTQSISLGSSWYMYAETDYKLFAFGVSADGYINTDITVVDATTADQPEVTGTLGMEIASISTSDITVNTTIEGYVGNYTVFPYPVEYYEADADGDPEYMVEIMMYTLEYYGYDLATADNFYIFNSALTNYSLSTAWNIYQDTDYVVLAAGIYNDGTVSTPVIVEEVTTEAVDPEVLEGYNKWLGTWSLTSTSSYVSGKPVTVEIIITEANAGESYEIYGFDISANRWYFGIPATYDAETGGWAMAAETYVTYESGYGSIYFSAFSYVHSPYDAYYFVSGEYDALFGEMSADGTTASISCASGTISDGTEFTVATVMMTLIDDAGSIYVFYTDDSLGLDDLERLVGPFTMSYVSDNTTVSYAAPAKAQAVTPYFNVVEAVINRALTANVEAKPEVMNIRAIKPAAKASKKLDIDFTQKFNSRLK